MVNSNKISIKVNIQNKVSNPDKLRQQTDVTEWNLKRIIAFLLVIIIILMIIAFAVYKKLPLPVQENKIQVVPDVELIKPESIQPKIEKKPENIPTIVLPNTKEPDVQKVAVKVIEEAFSYPTKSDSKKILRASLSTGLLEKEPIGIIDSSITVNKNQATAIYYFTEIIDMKESVLYHQWRWNNEIIFKKQINVMGNRWRATTRKLISYNKVGDWRVSLVNQNDIVLNELKFKVILK